MDLTILSICFKWSGKILLILDAYISQVSFQNKYTQNRKGYQMEIYINMRSLCGVDMFEL